MTLASSALAGDHVLCYRLQSEMGYVRLRLWEPPVVTGQAVVPESPYLYAANFTFPTLQEAEGFLREHLLANGAFDVPESNFPAEGAIAILPYPTWALEE
ncbi:MAG TPA: hypothetical protein V6D02_03320 [Candidatus Obscuribacterales bacterium]